MISGVTGAVAVVLVSLGIKVKTSLFPEMLINSLTESGNLVAISYNIFCCVQLWAGVIQVIIGLLRLGKLIRIV